MTELNSVGDVVVTESETMRALADPIRISLLDRLRREGPMNAAELASLLASQEPVIRGHLDELERVGLVARDVRGWSAVGKGLVFEIPDDPDGQQAARALTGVMLLHYVDVPRRWVADDESRVTLDWIRAAGMSNARVTVTPDELRGIQEALERLLEPFITRESDAVPVGAGDVRILSYFLPEP
ncbi:MAG TPA: helix-turn-helix domain-containing protein [Gaiellaceae bacterium]|nr:helix-turn-helix domain-containing protein [Gaiellaceae bacterium]HET8653366.1 helix-turn-helix domain-containing protein [Gaiellaceae bacterium]